MNNIYEKYLFLILASLFFSKGLSQNYSITHFNASNGFNASTVYGINQDSKGFLWIGTDVGLIRYDGNKFKQYGLKDGLSDLDVFNISIDSQDHVLLHNFSNQINYFHNGNLFTTGDEVNLSDNKNYSHPLYDYYEKEDLIILSFFNAKSFLLAKFDSGSIQSLKKTIIPDGYNMSGISVINNLYYIFYKKDFSKKRLYHVYNGTNKLNESILNKEPTQYTSIDKYICMSYKNRIDFYLIDDQNLLVFSHKINLNSEIKSINSNNNTLWVTMNKGGVLKIDPSGNIERFNENEIVNFSFIDRDSNKWIGTENNGLYYYKNNKIKNFKMDKLKTSKAVLSLCFGDGNNMYLGFGNSTIAEYKNGEIFNFHNLGNRESMKIKKIINLEKDSLLCVSDNFVYIVDSKKSIFSSSKLSSIIRGSHKDAISINKNEFIFGTSSQLFKISNGKYEQILNERITSIEIDSKKTIWIGTLKGIKKLPFGTNTPINVNINNIICNDISCNKGKIILATDSGIQIFNEYSNKIEKIITEENGLISNQCKKIITYKNSLWVATNSGICKIEFKKDGINLKNLTNYTLSDGLTSNFINDIIIKNDTVYIATNGGLSVFPCNLRKKQSNPIMNIIEAKSNLSNFNIHKPIKLTQNENNILITFSNMLFTKDKKHSYEYRLLPVQVEWCQAQENNITFSNLNPNDYTFEVRPYGKNINNYNSINLNFEVLPNFHQTLLFKLLLTLTFIITSLLFINWRLKIGKRKVFVEKTISQLELDAIKAQINPHFIYNCLTSIKNTIIKQENLKAEEQLSVFANMVRQTLSISQQNFITLDEELEYLKSYLEMEKIRFKENLFYSINLTDIPSTSKLQLPSMLIQPFVENAIKHGVPTDEKLPSIITLNFILKNNNLLCELQDNGPGISKSNPVSSHMPQGIQISSNRAFIYNKLYDTNIIVNFDKTSKVGALISISIPQKK